MNILYKPKHRQVDMRNRKIQLKYLENSIGFGNLILELILKDAGLCTMEESDVQKKKSEEAEKERDRTDPRHNYNYYYYSTEEIHEKMIKELSKQEIEYEVQHTAEDVISSKMVFVDDNLSNCEKIIALKNFKSQFELMDYSSWVGVPLYFSRIYSREKLGIIEVPYNFRDIDFLKYIEKHIDTIKKEIKDKNS